MFKNLICGLCAVSVSCVSAMNEVNIVTENHNEFLRPVSVIAQIMSIDKTFRKFVDDPYNNLESFCLGLKYAKNTFANSTKLKYIYNISKHIQTNNLSCFGIDEVKITTSCRTNFLASFNDFEQDDGHIQEVYFGKLYRISYTPHFCKSDKSYLNIIIKATN